MLPLKFSGLSVGVSAALSGCQGQVMARGAQGGETETGRMSEDAAKISRTAIDDA